VQTTNLKKLGLTFQDAQTVAWRFKLMAGFPYHAIKNKKTLTIQQIKSRNWDMKDY